MTRHTFSKLNEIMVDIKIEQLIHLTAFTEREKMFNEIEIWCKENCQGKVLVGAMYASFESKDDAFAFRLRWG